MTDPLAELPEIETIAVQLAQLAGAQIASSLGRTLAVRYKALDPSEGAQFRDPVSEVDQAVELLIRARLADRFPDHGIIGEENAPQLASASDFTWIIDPVDGTTNFVNGYPLFAASIGVAYKGRPVAGAVWCSASHALRPGVYHAREGGVLCFDSQPIASVDRHQVHRRIVGLPRVPPHLQLGYEARQSGSASIECAFVAAGLLAGARFGAPNSWDVAGGIPLLRAAGATVMTRGSDEDWTEFESFGQLGAVEHGNAPWQQPLVIGDAAAVSVLRSLDI